MPTSKQFIDSLRAEDILFGPGGQKRFSEYPANVQDVPFTGEVMGEIRYNPYTEEMEIILKK